jgi:CHAT domain-containing protein
MRRGASVVIILLSVCQAQTVLDAPPTGQVVTHEIAGGQTYSYLLNQPAGEFVEVIAFQRSIDVVVRLHNPEGTVVLESDSPTGTFGPEALAWVAEPAGTWRIEVIALDSKAKAGTYEFRIAARRPAEARDRIRAEGERLFSDASLAFRKSRETPDLRPRFLEAVDRFKQSGADVRAAAALVILSSYHPGPYRREAALVCLRDLEDAIAISHKAGDSYGEAFARSEAILAADVLQKAELALQYGEAAIEGLGRAGDLIGQAHAMGEVSRVLNFSFARYEDALAMAKRRLAVYQQLKDKVMEARARAGVSSLHFLMGEYDQNIEQLRTILAIYRDLKDVQGEASVLSGLAASYSALGRYDQALPNFEQALAMGRKAGNRPAEVASLRSLAKVHHFLGHTQLAADYAKQAESLIPEIPESQRVYAYRDMGLIYRVLGQFDQAIEWHQKALKIFREQRTRSYIESEAGTLLGLGDALAAAGRRQEAYAALEEARTLYRQIRELQNEASSLSALASLQITAKDYELATISLEPVLAMSRGARQRPREAEALAMFMTCAEGLGQPRLAVFFGKQAVNLYQSLRSELRSLDAADRKSYLQLHQATYRKLADLLLAQNRIAEAEQVLNLLKEDEFFEFVRRAAAIAPKQINPTPEEAEWEKRYREIGYQLVARGTLRSELLAKPTRTPEEERQLNEIDNDLAAGNHAYQQFMKDVAAHFAAKPNTGQDRVSQLREAEGLKSDLAELGHGAVVLYTLAGAEKYRVILITPEVQRAYEYPITAVDLARKVLEFRDAIQSPRRDPRSLAQELQRILIGPELERDLQQAHAETLMWSLDGALRYLPLAALYDGRQYLIEQYRIAIFTPASQARLKDKPKVQWSGLGFGVTKAHEDFTALPSVSAELRGIIRQSEAEQGVLHGRRLIDEDFTGQSMRETLRRQPAVVHIASHFRFQPGDETRSFLLLGDGSRLTLTDLKTLPDLFHGVELLTLSACNTGVGDAEADGKEVEGFSVLAQRGGAKSVLATLWPVGDESTSELMREFYRLRQSQPGMLKAEALRQAQLAILRGTGGAVTKTRNGETASLPLFKGMSDKAPYAHPYFWAPFFLTGNWQ